MPYWLNHPAHGEMVVYDRADVEKHEKLGWSMLNEGNAPQRSNGRQEHDKPARIQVEQILRERADDNGSPVAVEPQPEKRRPGRPRKG